MLKRAAVLLYAASMAEEADRIMDAGGAERLAYFASGWKLITRTVALEIAMDESAVENGRRSDSLARSDYRASEPRVEPGGVKRRSGNR